MCYSVLLPEQSCTISTVTEQTVPIKGAVGQGAVDQCSGSAYLAHCNQMLSTADLIDASVHHASKANTQTIILQPLNPNHLR